MFTTGILPSFDSRWLLLGSFAAGLLMFSGQVSAGNGQIKSMSLNLAASTGAVHVISKDGKKWSAIKPTELGLSGPISASMKTGYISSYHLRLGVCGNDA
jgi:hypothetical protein